MVKQGEVRRGELEERLVPEAQRLSEPGDKVGLYPAFELWRGSGQCAQE